MFPESGTRSGNLTPTVFRVRASPSLSLSLSLSLSPRPEYFFAVENARFPLTGRLLIRTNRILGSEYSEERGWPKERLVVRIFDSPETE